MNDATVRLEELYGLWSTQQLSEAQQNEFFELLALRGADERLDDLMKKQWVTAQDEQTLPIDARYAMAAKILGRNQSGPLGRHTVPRIYFLKTAWFRYAAVLLLLAGTATFLYITSPLFKKDPALAKMHQNTGLKDIQPGGNKAILTLSDGSTIMLDSVAIGALNSQGNTRILKLDAGKLAYQAGEATGQILYNTISTPKGGQYQVTLPDGSRVWLNAASSIRFATAFLNERRVIVTGEAYFEIARDKSKPFFITTHSADVQVLGTSFNINAYNDEPAEKTTLVEGSVKVIKKGGLSQLLAPGEQAVVAEQIVVLKKADIAQVTAWKNGVFNFENAGLKEVMRQLERWYDITVEYRGEIREEVFKGTLSRDLTLSQVLRILEVVDIHLRMEGRKLIVTS